MIRFILPSEFHRYLRGPIFFDTIVTQLDLRLLRRACMRKQRISVFQLKRYLKLLPWQNKSKGCTKKMPKKPRFCMYMHVLGRSLYMQPDFK